MVSGSSRAWISSISTAVNRPTWAVRDVELEHFTVFVSRSAMIISLLDTRRPKNNPYSQQCSSFSNFAVGFLCFHITFSANSKPITFARLPLHLSYAVLFSDATSKRFSKNMLYSHVHVNTGCWMLMPF